jgi:hypothetical protein
MPTEGAVSRVCTIRNLGGKNATIARPMIPQYAKRASVNKKAIMSEWAVVEVPGRGDYLGSYAMNPDGA